MCNVLVCGGRDYQDHQHLFATLDDLHKRQPIALVIHGNQRGADKLAGEWARQRNCPCTPYPADWGRLGRKAGPIRNAKMLNDGQPDLVVAFPGSAGTASMIRLARRAGVEVIIAGLGTAESC
jgi:hypothetical protein